MMQQAWTTTDIETLEAIELPTREAFTGLCGGLITVDLDVNIDVDVDADVSLGGDCDSDSGGSSGGSGGSSGGGKCK
jgi:hypothetical protein